MKITREQARNFYRDLCGTIYGDTGKNSGGLMTTELIATHMRISNAEAKSFCEAMIEHGITERSYGMIIV